MKKTIIIILIVIVVILGIYFLVAKNKTAPTDTMTSMDNSGSPGSNSANTGTAPKGTTANGSATTPVDAMNSTASKTPITATVNIQNHAFSPVSLTVAKGGQVTWTNHDTVTHTVTSDSGLFDSGSLAPGATFTYTFAATGTFAYHCTPHPDMHGSVTVTN